MISIAVRKGQIDVSGHANAGPYGQDIVCAGVSALTLTLLWGLRFVSEDEVEDSAGPCETVVGQSEQRGTCSGRQLVRWDMRD